MGTWGGRIYDNDDAADWSHEVTEGGLSAVGAALDAVLQAEYVEVTHPAYSWARLLGLTDPDGAGKRRVLDAIDWLDSNGYVTRTRNPGQPSTVRLLADDGSAEPYTKPATTSGGRPTYRQLDHDWWRNGWLASVSGVALVVWLAYLDASGNRQGAPAWLAPSRTRNRYGMSDDTRQDGLSELRGLGLVDRRRVRRREPFVAEHPITTYALQPDRLHSRPDDGMATAVAALSHRVSVDDLPARGPL